jgi:hypothetical protein
LTGFTGLGFSKYPIHPENPVNPVNKKPIGGKRQHGQTAGQSHEAQSSD